MPVLTAGSDPLTEAGVAEGWAVRRPAGDVAGLADLFVRFAGDPVYRDDLRVAARAGRQLRTWERVAAPLVAAVDAVTAPSAAARLRRGGEAVTAGVGRRAAALLRRPG
jgi:hypothetical protein